MRKILVSISIWLLLGFGPAVAAIIAQDGSTEIPEDIDSLFGEASDEPGTGDAGAAAPAGTDVPGTEGDLDGLFEDGDSVRGDAGLIDNPEEAFLENEGVTWGGDFTGRAEAQLRYRNLLPTGDEWGKYQDVLSFTLNTRLSFDARPDKNFRVAGKIQTGYPFVVTQKLRDGSTVTVPNIRVYELFSDFNWKERVFFRFGKQAAAWGLSYFYQVADPISTEVKNPEKAAEVLEGPVALKVTLPVGAHTLFGYAVAKESYLPVNPLEIGLDNLGYGLKGDFFLRAPENTILRDAEISFGGYYQKDLAPRLIAGISTAVWDIAVFSDQVLSYGADSYRLTSTEAVPGLEIGGTKVYGTEKPKDVWFYSATAGFSYYLKDWKMMLIGEYFFNGQGSNDPDYLKKYKARLIAENLPVPIPGIEKTLSFSDLAGYASAHNTALNLSFSELAGSDKLSAGLFWQQNWTDKSGMVIPSFTYAPWKYFSVNTGLRIAYGADDAEFVLKNSDPSSMEPRRLTGFIGVTLGSGRF